MELRNKLKLVRHNITLLGFKEAIKAILVHLFSYHPARDTSFDKRYKTDTAATVGVNNLGISDDLTMRSALHYVSSPVKFERHIIDSLEIDYMDFDFVDIGSGKGRVLMLAAERPFRSYRRSRVSSAVRYSRRFPSARRLAGWRKEDACAS